MSRNDSAKPLPAYLHESWTFCSRVGKTCPTYHDNTVIMAKTWPWLCHGEYETPWSCHDIAWASCLTMVFHSGCQPLEVVRWDLHFLNFRCAAINNHRINFYIFNYCWHVCDSRKSISTFTVHFFSLYARITDRTIKWIYGSKITLTSKNIDRFHNWFFKAVIAHLTQSNV